VGLTSALRICFPTRVAPNGRHSHVDETRPLPVLQLVSGGARPARVLENASAREQHDTSSEKVGLLWMYGREIAAFDTLPSVSSWVGSSPMQRAGLRAKPVETNVIVVWTSECGRVKGCKPHTQLARLRSPISNRRLTFNLTQICGGHSCPRHTRVTSLLVHKCEVPLRSSNVG
jgi:hypothetical protein